MVAVTKANGFVEHLSEQTHNLGTGTITVALSNTAPASETNNPLVLTADCILANVTQISYTNLSSRVITTSSSAQSGGTYTLALNDITMTSSGGATGPFRYIYLYNDSTTSPVDAILWMIDYGSALTLNDGESLTLDFNASTMTLV